MSSEFTRQLPQGAIAEQNPLKLYSNQEAPTKSELLQAAETFESKKRQGPINPKEGYRSNMPMVPAGQIGTLPEVIQNQIQSQKRPLEDAVVPDAKRTKTTAATTPEPTIERKLTPLPEPPIQGQFAQVGSVIDTERQFLRLRLDSSEIDPDTRKIYDDRLTELNNARNQLIEYNGKMNLISDPAIAKFYRDKATELLYGMSEKSQIAKEVSAVAERMNLLQAIYAPSEDSAYGPQAGMRTALFSMPDINNDGIVDDKDLYDLKDTGKYGRNLALRDQSGMVLLYSGKYDFENLDKINRIPYNEYKRMRKQLDLPKSEDVSTWPKDKRDAYIGWVSMTANNSSGYDKLKAYGELMRTKPYEQWTEEDRKGFMAFSDAYVITDENYGQYLVTRDNPQWNAKDANVYNMQLARGGNRYYVDHTGEKVMKVLGPLVTALSIAIPVASLGAAAVGAAASAIGSTLGTLGGASSLSVGSGLAGGSLSLSAAAGGIGATAASSTLAGGVSGAVASAVNSASAFAAGVVASGGQTLAAAGMQALNTLVPVASELVTKTAVSEIAQAAGADPTTLSIIDAVGTLGGSIAKNAAKGGMSLIDSGVASSKEAAFNVLKDATSAALTGPAVVNALAKGAQALIDKTAPEYAQSLTRIVSAGLSGEDIKPSIQQTVQELATNSFVKDDTTSTVSNFTKGLSSLMSSMQLTESFMGSSLTGAATNGLMFAAQDYLLNQLPKMRASQFKSPVEERFFMEAAREAYSDTPRDAIGPYSLQYVSDTIKVYTDPQTHRLMIGIRGTKDARDRSAWIPTGVGNLTKTERYNYDKAQVREIMKRFPPEQYAYFISGHSIGGAISTQLRRDFPFIQKAVTYNAATAPRDVMDKDAKDVYRVYNKEDPLYNFQGGKLTASEVRGSKSTLPRFPIKEASGVTDPLFTAINLYQGHKMDKFFVDERRSASYSY